MTARRHLRGRRLSGSFRALCGLVLIVGVLVTVGSTRSEVAFGIGGGLVFETQLLPVDNYLNAISCPTSTTCVGVGNNGTQPSYSLGVLADSQWTWSQPSVIAPDQTGTGSFNDVACPTSTTCIATGHDGGGVSVPMFSIGSEVGGEWSWPPSSYLEPLNSQMEPSGISCPSASQCVIVGYSGAVPVYDVATEVSGAWTWSGIATMLPPSAYDLYNMDAVACPTATTCVAGGADNQGSMFPTGTQSGGSFSWSENPQPQSVSDGPTVRGISCPTTNTCVAVGGNSYFVGTQTAGVWSWASAANYVSDGTGSGTVLGVDCPTSSWCLAVGADNNNTVTPQPIISIGTYVNGEWSWTNEAAVSVSGGSNAFYSAVTCMNVGSCIVIGLSGSGSPSQRTIVSDISSTSPPSAPSISSATSGDGLADVSWSAPSQDNGSAITGYTLSATDVENNATITDACPDSVSTTSTNCTATGLTNGVEYRFIVAAINADGTGAFSAPSALVTPEASGGGGSGGSSGGSGAGTSGGGGSSGAGVGATSPAPSPPVVSAPQPVPIPREVTYGLFGSSLSARDRQILRVLARKLTPNGSITVVGYARDDVTLAKDRASAVAKFLEGLVALHVTIRTDTASAVGKVIVTTTRQ